MIDKEADGWILSAMMLLEFGFDDAIPDDERPAPPEECAWAAHQLVQSARARITGGPEIALPEFVIEILAKVDADTAIDEARYKGNPE